MVMAERNGKFKRRIGEASGRPRRTAAVVAERDRKRLAEIGDHLNARALPPSARRDALRAGSTAIPNHIGMHRNRSLKACLFCSALAMAGEILRPNHRLPKRRQSKKHSLSATPAENK